MDSGIIFIIPPKDTVTIEGSGFTIFSLLEYPIIERFSMLEFLGFSSFDVEHEASGGFILSKINKLCWNQSSFLHIEFAPQLST